MSQKFRTLLVAMLCIMFFTISNTANAANVEVTKDFFKSFMNGSVNMWNFVRLHYFVWVEKPSAN